VTGPGPCRLDVFGIVASSEGTNDRTRSSSHATRGKHLAWPRRNALLRQLLCWSILASKAEGHTFERCRTRQIFDLPRKNGTLGSLSVHQNAAQAVSCPVCCSWAGSAEAVRVGRAS